jgi:serine/threonine protein kinase
LRERPLPVQQAAELVLSMANAVHYAHTWGIYHLNLKPSKVLFDSAGNPAVNVFRQLPEGTIYCTPAYMAPEQAAGETARLGPKTDVYGLGVILYECLTGQRPFKDVTTRMEMREQVLIREPIPPRQLNPKVPRDLEAVCLKCLQKEPGRRYASARELADELGRVLVGKEVTARPITWLERPWKTCRRNPAVAVAAVVLALLMVLAAVLWLSFQAILRLSFR